MILALVMDLCCYKCSIIREISTGIIKVLCFYSILHVIFNLWVTYST
ncbi:hypothetical protein APHCR_0224 [Anaplasma phagocytophilum str. CR1007]|uniref:Uncharacterized protein n=1 Tax=Anaplasma phagocytophilum str. NCH-1 TaxID=1359161 RepID=A0A0F3N6E3_ANAPH|nr:hypothetical protein EPHNCH_1027 [Anaplasma phagocytophilum str. NCH-1]KJZ99129.1 hypothetical protein APHCR_0224 [Anaplasma phagocytophilum str. CR1007]KKA00170.1 hypothetical protein APHDU1_0006 [Anaplasma phagocytophilum]